jgi:hypothetical protein
MYRFEKKVKEKSDSELTEIFIKNRGYQEEFMLEVQKELIYRNIPIDPLLKFRDEQNKIDETKLELGQQGSQFWITVGFICAVVGGIWAVFAGYNYAYSKHKVKGKEYFVYNESTRKNGRIMLTVGSIIFALVIINKIANFFKTISPDPL